MRKVKTHGKRENFSKNADIRKRAYYEKREAEKEFDELFRKPEK